MTDRQTDIGTDRHRPRQLCSQRSVWGRQVCVYRSASSCRRFCWHPWRLPSIQPRHHHHDRVQTSSTGPRPSAEPERSASRQRGRRSTTTRQHHHQHWMMSRWNNDWITELEGAPDSAYLRQVNFYRRPLSEKFLRGHVRTIHWNTHVKSEVHSFNRFGAISI